MQLPRMPHRWTVSPEEAVAIQKRLAARVSHEPPRRPIRLVAGVDAAFSRDGGSCIAAVVVWDHAKRELVEKRVATRKLTFPYVPGLLSFREAPAILAALRRLRTRPDAVICDGHGLAHPRRFGIACHVGVVTRLPSFGCAKSLLVGEYREPDPERGSLQSLVHRGEIVGAVLRTRDRVRPVFISVGHRINRRIAVTTTLRCTIGYRLPEPTRLADRLVAEVKRR